MNHALLSTITAANCARFLYCAIVIDICLVYAALLQAKTLMSYAAIVDALPVISALAMQL